MHAFRVPPLVLLWHGMSDDCWMHVWACYMVVSRRWHATSGAFAVVGLGAVVFRPLASFSSTPFGARSKNACL